MPEQYTIGKLRGGLALVFYDENRKRHRISLGTSNPSEAKQLAPSLYAEVTRPKGKTVAELWAAYDTDKVGRAVLASRKTTWKALKDRFGSMPGDQITVADCRAYIGERRSAVNKNGTIGKRDGTIYTELSHLRTTLVWAFKRGLVHKACYIERPQQPEPKEGYLTKLQARALIDAAELPHTKLYIILALSTGARNAALLGLTWVRCDFDRGLIDLRDPTIPGRHKGRAIVPMSRTAKAALVEAKKGALSDFVVEWAGERVASVKKSLKAAATAAGLDHVSPHMLRHSAAVHMAEDGIPMEEIAQFLGHTDVKTTRKVYARFSPDYLRRAAEALEYN